MSTEWISCLLINCNQHNCFCSLLNNFSTYLLSIQGFSVHDKPQRRAILSETLLSFLYLLKTNSHSGYAPVFGSLAYQLQTLFALSFHSGSIQICVHSPTAYTHSPTNYNFYDNKTLLIPSRRQQISLNLRPYSLQLLWESERAFLSHLEYQIHRSEATVSAPAGWGYRIFGNDLRKSHYQNNVTYLNLCK